MIKAIWTSDICRTVRAVAAETATTYTELDELVELRVQQACGKPFFRVENEDGVFIGYVYFDGNQMSIYLRPHMNSYLQEVINLRNMVLCEVQAPCCDVILLSGCNLLLNGQPIEG